MMAPPPYHYDYYIDYLAKRTKDINPLPRFLHLNARSVKADAKFDQIQFIIASFDPDFVLISETWLREGEECYFNIKGYYCISLSRKCGRGGGLLMYIKQHYSFKIFAQLQKQQSVLSVLIKNQGLTFNLVLAYNPHFSNTPLFMNDLEEALEANNHRKILMGDINVNLLSPIRQVEYVQTMSLYGLTCLNNTVITRPSSLSLLDHVFVSHEFLNGLAVSVIRNDISDHSLIVADLHDTNPKGTHYTPRNLIKTKLDYNVIRNYLDANTLEPDTDDVHVEYSRFGRHVGRAITAGTMLTQRSRATTRKKFPEWATVDFTELVHRKECWLEKTLRDPCNITVHEEYRRCCNTVRHMSRKLKSDYIDRANSLSTAKEQWRALNVILNRKSKTCEISQLEIGDLLITEPGLIVEALNAYFINVADNIDQAKICDTFPNLGGPRIEHFHSVTPAEVLVIIRDLDSKSSINQDVPVEVLKSCGDLLIR